MRKEDGLSILWLCIIIVILIVIAYFAANKIFGQNGILDNFKTADIEYNKTEVVDSIKDIVKQKYILDSKYASENKKEIKEIYNEQALLKYLIDKNYIEQLKDIDDNVVQDQYYINLDALESDVAVHQTKENGSKGNGTKVFKLKKENDKYNIYYVDKYGNEQLLGELVYKLEELQKQ